MITITESRQRFERAKYIKRRIFVKREINPHLKIINPFMYVLEIIKNQPFIKVRF